MSGYIPILFFFVQIAVAQPDSLVKYFSTNIMRTNVLKGKPEKSVDKKEAHFKAVYYPSGELKSIEFLPANWDKKKRKKTKSPGRVTLYYLKWNPKTQELLEGLTRREARAWPHYKAIVDDQGLVREVDYVSRNGKTQWTFYMKWDDYGKSKEYDIEFHSKKDLSQLIEIILSKIQYALIKNERVELRDIFTLETKIQKARISRNPKTNEKIEVPEKKTVQFKMSKKWFNNINNNE